MAVIGVSLIVASVLWVIVRPPPWISHFLLAFRRPGPTIDRPKPADGPRRDGQDSTGGVDKAIDTGDKLRKAEGEKADEGEPEILAQSDCNAARDAAAMPPPPLIRPPSEEGDNAERTADKAARDRAAMPPPPATSAPKTEQNVDNKGADKVARDRAAMPPPPLIASTSTEGKDDTEQTTPKAEPSQPTHAPIPDFSLPPASTPGLHPPASFPAANSPQRASGNNLSPAPNRLPSLAPPARPNPLPNRGPPSSSSSLAPPPTHSSKPAKPSRKVMLSPGHSPLDWAAISGPKADLRNLPPSTPYLRVTPSMLKKQNGRKGNDAWMVLGGRVYNVTPYANYHPGGVGELMRGAGKDGTKLFGEVHPWVNYEGMLQACLVGIYVDEGEKSTMEDMD